MSLTIFEGPLAGRKIWLLGGQIAEIGRNASADLAVPHDRHMADIHFSLECRRDRCLVSDLSGGLGTLVNGEPIETAADLNDGDLILAGETNFVAHVEGGLAATAAAATLAASDNAAPAAPASGFAKITDPLATDICERFQLDQGASLLRDWYTPRQFLEVLVEHQHWPDAFRLLAHGLPKREAVWWATVCVSAARPTPSEIDQQALEAAAHWAQHPTEENRRAALPAGEATGCETPAGLAAMAAFFSEGSLVAPEYDAVPPPELLTAQTVSAAVILAGTWGDPAKIETHYRQFVTDGIAVADGENTWPEPETNSKAEPKSPS